MTLNESTYMKTRKFSRRKFLIKTGLTGLSFILTKPVYALSKILSNLRNPKIKLLDFIHVTDVHITDGSSLLRVEILDNISYLKDAKRPQQHLSVAAFDAVIRSINNQHKNEPVDFMISTGDQVDNAMQNEMQWFKDVINGVVMSDDYLEFVQKGVMPQLNTQGLDIDIPFYTAIGNHDTMVVGSFPGKLMKIIHKNMRKKYGFEIITQKDMTELFFDNGFDKMPEYMDGYYSFTPNDYIHCIVLNTNNDNWIEGVVDRFLSYKKGYISKVISLQNIFGRKIIFRYILEYFFKWMKRQSQEIIGGIPQGTLNRIQFEWMKQEIEENSDKLCLVFSHHGTDSFFSPVGNVMPGELRSALCSYDNVIAHIYGHTHKNRITKEECIYGGSYWNINTCSIIEYPQEWRRISIWDSGNGTGILSCCMFGHEYNESLDLSMNDPQADNDKHAGRYEDRDVELKFNIPLFVAKNITKKR